MKHSLLALLTLCVMSGCAAKKPVKADPPGIRRGCHEVSVNYTTQEVTVICPLKQEKK